jgi:DNA-binding transcriptional ArsR family regulator
VVDGLSATRLARTFLALADPTRIRLISALLVRELCVCELRLCWA